MKRLFHALAALLAVGTLAGHQSAFAQAEEQEDKPQTREPPTADPAWLGWCIENEGGTTLADAPCYVRHREALTADQKVLLKRIEGRLAKTGPAATDYPKALTSLREAQQHWEAYTRADCDVLDYVFGAGTALGLAGETCIIDHYQARSDELRQLESDFLNQ
jgi:uncharacterized protein YecT (DUF1311 family)